MLKKTPLTLAIGILLILVFALLLFSFQVRTTEVAVVTTFGRPTRPITEPNLYFKWPWPIQKVYKFDQRIHSFESKFEQVLTADGYSLLISVYAGWNINDPKAFFPRFGGSAERAQETLEGLIRNAYSGVVGNHPFAHFISTDEKELKFLDVEKEMLQKVRSDAQANTYGLDVKFIGIKRLGLPEGVTQLVMDRMQSERAFHENKIKAEGESQAQIIRADADLQSSKLLAEADAEATRIRGQGQREAAKSFEVFKQNPELANFLLKLSGMESSLKERAVLIFDQNTPPFDIFKDMARPTNRVSVLAEGDEDRAPRVSKRGEE